MDPKETLHRYLRTQRSALVGKLDGLGEYEVRRPLTPTGTNLLGVVKHVASIQLGYLGDCFGRPSGIPLPWFDDDADPDADLWATAVETRASVLELYRRSAEHADATITALDLETTGEVAWWPPERRHPSLHTILVHLLVDVARHAGQADILREGLDGVVGYLPGSPGLPERDEAGWREHRGRVEAAAREASARAGRAAR
jgi:uncharacterized damage-inducible protein DinB